MVRDREDAKWEVRYLQSKVSRNQVICWSVYITVATIKQILNDDKVFDKPQIYNWNYHQEIPYVSIQELWDKANLNPDEYRLINNLN